MNKYKDQLLLN